MGVCAKENVGKGKLKLVAYGQLSKLDPNSTYKVGPLQLVSAQALHRHRETQQELHVGALLVHQADIPKPEHVLECFEETWS